MMKTFDKMKNFLLVNITSAGIYNGNEFSNCETLIQ